MDAVSTDIVKRKWQKPELVILVRSRPEEAVLLVCKHGGQYTGPDGNNCRSNIQHVKSCSDISKS